MKKNNQYKKTVVIVLLLSILMIIGIYSRLHKQKSTQPVATNGYLDLSNWDFEKSGSVKLDGEWEFYWNKLLSPVDFVTTKNKVGYSPDGYMKVPSTWNATKLTTTVSDKGAATYRLKVKLRSSSITYGIKSTSIRMSSKLYVDGRELGGSGKPALSEVAGYETGNVPYVTYFYTTENELEILVQVADFDYQIGGIVQSIYLGEKSDISTMWIRSIFLNIFTATCLLITGIYYLQVYVGKRKDLAVLYYSLSALTFALTLISYGEKSIMQILPEVSFIALVKAQNVFMFFTTILTCLFANKVTKSLLPKWFAPAVVIGLGSFATIFPILSLRVSSELQNFFMMYGLVAYCIITGYLFRAIKRKQYDILTKAELVQLFAAFVCILLFFGDGIAYNNNWKNSNYFGYTVLIVFIGVVSVMLSQQYRNAYHTIEKMNLRLIELDKLKDEFLENTSHELRTPLNGIINLTQAVIEKSNDTLDISQQENLRLVIACGKRLTKLINDILDIACLKRGEIKLHKKPTDVKTLVSIVFRVMEHLKDDKEVEFINEIPEDLPLADADEERLLQIYYNLIGNALKFTTKGKIEAGGRKHGKGLTLWIKDTGCGIPYEKQDEIFNAFFQVQSVNLKENQGTGLGLSITKQLIELHGGSISVTSIPGEGSCFYLTLPISSGMMAENTSILRPFLRLEDPIHKIVESKNQTGDYTILVADDDAISLKALVNMLDSENYAVKAVKDGQQVLEELENTSNYDLIILDVMMPKQSGYQVLEKIRRRFSSAELPVILLTAKGRVQDVTIGFQAGANDYIIKPFEAEELKSRVRTLVQLKKTVTSLLAAELDFLQAQIKPHFLYNALSVITSLSTREPARAKELLIYLSEYLRGSFNFVSYNGMVSLSDEIQTVTAYLKIEEARFEERLKIEYDIDKEIAVLIPILCIQPLVENSVRHGILQRVEGGTVKISVKSSEDQVIITVEDDGVGIPSEKLEEILNGFPSKSVGMRNVHKRMMALYGHGLYIESIPEIGTKVIIHIPIR